MATGTVDDMEVKMLDAGYSLQLQSHVEEVVDGHPLWTARFILDNPTALLLTHRDFIRAGSMIIRANTYQATVDGFIKHLGLTKEESLLLIDKAVCLAREAIALENKVGKVLVAGSVGPYGASLHDGSEYTGSYCDQVTHQQLISWHRDRVQQLVASSVDLLAIETVPCIKEAKALVQLIKEFPQTKAWLSFSIRDEKCISNGEKFVDAVEEVLKAAEGSDQLVAIGVNCLNPKFVTPLLIDARARFPHQPFVVYPNSGENYNKQLQRWEEVSGMTPVCDYVQDWLDLGVRYVGGCCRTMAKDLPAILSAVDKWTSKRRATSSI